MHELKEKHYYGNFIPANSKYMLVGTFPISKKSKENKIDFYYGGKRNQLWHLISKSTGVKLDTTSEIKTFLRQKKIAIGDTVASCSRKNGLSSDSDLKNITFNTKLKNIIEQSKIEHLFFTSEKSRSWFESKIGCDKQIKKTTLISPSGGGLRRFTTEHELSFQKWLSRHPGKSRTDFRSHFYKEIFNRV